MSIYAIADLHLSTKTADKSMEVFGKRWDGYMDRIERNWRHLVKENDTVIIPGDISWALSLEDAADDLLLIDSLPGKKILGKGNHDYWWSTMKKHSEFFSRIGIHTISFLYNNAYDLGDMIVAGTRGWYIDEDSPNAPENSEYGKLMNREVMRLKTSLTAAKSLQGDSGREIACFLHFPPVYNGEEITALTDLIEEFGVRRVYYGHIHGKYSLPPVTLHRGVEYRIISADYLEFVPKFVI